MSNIYFTHSFTYLLTITTFVILYQPVHALFGVEDTLPKQVHHWLHWGANLHHSSQASPAPHPRASTIDNFLTKSSQSIPTWVIGAGTTNRTFQIDYQLQMMHKPEVDLIASYLNPNDVYLEYGSGGSTYNLVPMVSKAYSIEHNCEWASFLSTKLSTKYPHLSIKCVPVRPGFRGWGTLSDFEHGNYEQFREYVDAVEQLPDSTFDKVLIDGRARLACALKILPFLKSDSLVFVHDFYARLDHYGALLPYYTEVARVLATNNKDPRLGPLEEPQGLIVLRRAENATYPIAPSEIDKIYKQIDWRYPFGPPLTSIHGYVSLIIRKLTDCGCWGRARRPSQIIEMVGGDLLHGAMVYAIVMFIVRQWAKYRAQKTDMEGNGIQDRNESSNPTARSTGNLKPRQNSNNATIGINIGTSDMRQSKSEPRFVETEGMRAAKARRKRAQNDTRKYI